MSESESRQAALQILCHQLTHITFDGTGSLPAVDRFITHFEAILDAISLLTKSSFPPAVKKTMLQTQLRGEPEVWCWGSKEFRDLGYEDFKIALRQKWGKEKDDTDKRPKTSM